MHLNAISSAFPPHTYTQEECWESVRDSPASLILKPRSLSLLEKILTGDSGIRQRHFCLADRSSVFLRDAGELNAEFEHHAPKLAGEALAKALDNASLDPTELDALFVCTCTGYLCPGVSSHVSEDLGLRPNAYLQDLVGLGCGAAIPTLHSASNFIASHPGARAAVVAVEICSAAFYIDDDPGVLISLCLFGDGASASIWSSAPPEKGPAYQITGFRTVHKPESREKIRFVNDKGKLRNKLHRTVPELAGATVRELFEGGGHNGNIDRVLAHPGGRDVVEAIERELDLPPLAESRAVLESYGNLSSPSVLVALEKHLASSQPGRHLWLTAFGAGFSCHCAEMTLSE